LHFVEEAMASLEQPQAMAEDCSESWQKMPLAGPSTPEKRSGHLSRIYAETLLPSATTCHGSAIVHESARLCLQAMPPLHQRLVKLNVGGIVYETSGSTLLVDHESILPRMLRDYYARAPAGDRTLFIDRDGHRFGNILNYLRNGTVWLDDLPSLHALREEATYFCLESLVALTTDKIDQIEKQMADDDERSSNLVQSVSTIHEELECLKHVLQATRQESDISMSANKRPRQTCGYPIFTVNADF